MSAPIRQGRRVQTFPAQDRPDAADLGRGIRLRQNPQLRRRRDRSTPRQLPKKPANSTTSSWKKSAPLVCAARPGASRKR